MSGRPSSLQLCLSALLSLSLVGAAAAGDRGYTRRACGFDMDRDGIVGEPEDCQVCNAALVDDMIVGGTTDPDHDGTDEDLVYVDCDTGINLPSCGIEGKRPCRTIEAGLARLDGASDGAEDILCIRGTCTPNLVTPPGGGVPGTYSTAPAGNQTRPWLFPRDPAMIVGWDADGDRKYPPYDPDDFALMDGGAPYYHSRTFVLQGGQNDYYEMAHFSVANYGQLGGSGQTANLGFMSPNGASFLHLHDIEADGINQDRSDDQACGGDSAVSAFNMFNIFGMQYFSIVNSRFTNFGGYWMRGAAGDSDALSAGPIRVQRTTMTAHGWDHCWRGPLLVKLWGYVNGFEFLDNVVDGNVDAWDATQRGAQGITVAQCARDFDIVNNSFHNLFVAVHVQGSALFSCHNEDARTVDDIVITWNDISTDAEIDRINMFTGVTGIDLTDGGNSNGETSENVTIAHNVISCAIDCIACTRSDSTYSGPAQPGKLIFTHNMCRLDDLRTTQSTSGSVTVLDRAATPRQSFAIVSNAMVGHVDGELAMNLHYAPADWTADENCFDAEASFVWNRGPSTNLDSWRTSSGGDLHSDSAEFCTPPHVPATSAVGLVATAACVAFATVFLLRVGRGRPGA